MIKYILPMILCPVLAYADGFGFLPPTGYAPIMIVAGLMLLGLEFSLPTKGLLGLAGIGLFAAGTSGLAHHPDAVWRLSWPMIITVNILVIGVSLGIAWLTYRGYNARNEAVTETLIHHEAKVTTWDHNSQTVEIGGVLWNAVSPSHSPLMPGDKVVVVKQDNLTLSVIPKGEMK